MKVLGIMGSPRVGGNSDILLDEALAGAKDAGAEVEKIILDKKKISGCKDCKKCNETGVCVIKDDMLEIPRRFWMLTPLFTAYRLLLVHDRADESLSGQVVRPV